MSKAKKQKKANKHRALSAQQTIPYIAMHPDGICQLPGGLYTKTLEYEDINYAVASTEDQTAIISGYGHDVEDFCRAVEEAKKTKGRPSPGVTFISMIRQL